MRTEQKLVLAAGVVGCGFVASLLFRQVTNLPESPTTTPRPHGAPELNLRLRREPTSYDSAPRDSNLSIRPSAFTTGASIHAIPDDQRTATSKHRRQARTTPPTPLANQQAEETAITSTPALPPPTVAAPVAEQPVNTAPPAGKIRDVISTAP